MEHLIGREVVSIANFYAGFPMGARGVVVETHASPGIDYLFVRAGDGETYMMDTDEVALPIGRRTGIGV